jgi:hypothetical protein
MMRAGRLVACLAALFAFAGAGWATPPDVITKAEYAKPTTRYDHGVLGDKVEWGALILTVDKCWGCEGKIIKQKVIRLPESRVFEDTAPRIFQDEDGITSVMVVETDLARGARLAIYDENGLRDATPFIGRTHRWLAPIGAADLDGDHRIEIAYVDRPHLAKRLRLWRFEGGKLRHLGDLEGLTNHQIGWDFIAGGIRDCGQGPEMITADAGWARIVATRFDGKTLRAREIARYEGPKSFGPVMECRK